MRIYLDEVKKYYSWVFIFKYAVLLTSALFIIDILNFPTKLLLAYDMKITVVLIMLAFLFFILTAVEFHLFDAFKIVSINIIDAIYLVILLSSILYSSISLIYASLSPYKIVSLILILIIVIELIRIRSGGIKKAIETVGEYKSNVIDLKDIYNGKFSMIEGQPIMLGEKEVDYDLLNRSSVINLLYDTIQNCNPNEGFVISLEGSWGSGKTTIISNVKRMLKANEEIIIIDELDPWSYANQESLFYSMFDTIIQKSGIKFNSLLTKQMADSIYSSLFGSKKTNMIKSFLKPIDTIDVLKNRINDYLKFSGKKVIFFIDNIDRAESENIVLLFKLIGNVFDFERVIYILSFDNKQVKNAFENNLSIDYQYLKKIIQMQIFVPEVDRSVLEDTMSRCLNNILIAYGEDLSKLSSYHSFIRAICKLTEDFRDFKRYINSVLNTHVNNINYLDVRDLLSIEYIRLNNIQLYNTIYKNRKYFISHDRMVDKEVYSSVIDRAAFNISGKQFFDTLFEDQNNAKYLDLLQEIFPYVKRYHTNHQLEYDGNAILRDDSYQEISKNNRICSGKYFDLYFTKTGNEYLEIGNRVGQFVKRINNIQDSETPAQILKDLLASMPDYYQKEFFERLQLYIDDLQNESIYELTIALFKSINDIDNTRGFLSLSARSRVEIIIWGLLQMINEEQYKEFLEKIKSDYDKVQNISSLLYWFKHDKEGKNITGRMEEMEKLYKEMCARIIEDSIDLYDDKYYNKGNIWGLVRCYEEDLSIIKNYIKDVINKDNIFRLLYDIIGISQGSELRYSISNENLCYFTTKDDIDEILKDVETVTDDQEFILQVYNNYRNDSKDDWGETGIVSNQILDLKP